MNYCYKLEILVYVILNVKIPEYVKLEKVYS